MTTTAPPLTGQDINLAARATRLLLVANLETIDTTFEEWIVINLVGTDPTTTETAARHRLATTLGLDHATLDTLFDGLAASDLLERDGDALALTADGQRRWDQGRVLVADLIASLYAGFEPDDLATARRVLVEVTERAEAQLAG